MAITLEQGNLDAEDSAAYPADVGVTLSYGYYRTKRSVPRVCEDTSDPTTCYSFGGR